MCIKIVSPYSESEYNPSLPIEGQIKDSTEIVINYEPFDKTIDSFLKEIKRFSIYGTGSIVIKVIHNNHVLGAKAKKEFNKVMNDINTNKVIRALVLNYSETDKKLCQLADKFKDICK